MRAIEIIHLRQAGSAPQDLVEIIRDSVGSAPELTDVRIYRHSKLENDLAIHLHWKTTGENNSTSDVGVRLAAVLKEIGMVSHAVWSERFSLGNDLGPNEDS